MVYSMQVNLCTLAIREEQLPDLFSLPGSSRLHISVRKAVTAETNVRLNYCTPLPRLAQLTTSAPVHMLWTALHRWPWYAAHAQTLQGNRIKR